MTQDMNKFQVSEDAMLRVVGSDLKVHCLGAIICGKHGEGLFIQTHGRSRNILNSIKSSMNSGRMMQIGDYTGSFRTENGYITITKSIDMGYDRLSLYSFINKEVTKSGGKYLVTSEEFFIDDFYNRLKEITEVGLKKEWIPILIDELISNKLVKKPCDNIYWLPKAWQIFSDDVITEMQLDSQDYVDFGIELHGKHIGLRDVIVYDFSEFNNEEYESILSSLVKNRKIIVSKTMSKPLELDAGLDGYMTHYAPALIKKFSNEVKPLRPNTVNIDGFVSKKKRAKAQQNMRVNGALALFEESAAKDGPDGSPKHAFLIEGMGSGKTYQAEMTVDAYFNRKWLRNHPGKTLKDMYLSEDKPNYRTIVMAPSHLLEKWKEDIESEIPGSKAQILSSFKDVTDLWKRGKVRHGREWYLISKDFAKLGSMQSPIPNKVAKMIPKGSVCSECKTEGKIVFKTSSSSRARCVKCGSRKFEPYPMVEYGEIEGLVCPSCGNLLLKPSLKMGEDSLDTESMSLRPRDFVNHTATNDICYVCGEHLWGVDVRPIGHNEEIVDKRKWYKVSHYKNMQKKARKTVFLLKNYENDYFSSVGMGDVEKLDVKKSPIEYGPRRVSPAQFIKKHMKDWFDFAVLDEVHKFENGGTAQSIAAHALIRCSRKVLGLTGTISNGRADSLFYLLYMVEPRRMKRLGFDYGDVMKFSKEYGSIETTYESKNDGDVIRNSVSRGRQIGQPRVKPGMSPRLVVDFLFDRAVFMDLSDMGASLPELHEYAIGCELPDDVSEVYNHTITSMKEAYFHRKAGRGLMSSMLQYALAYPDKPYGFNDVIHPYNDDDLICHIPDCEQYRDGELLPKERKTVEIINNEISEGRNCFVYCAFTGSAEMNVTKRLKDVIETHCNLKGKVLIMEAASPKATERELYIKQKAAEGYKVIICNLKLVETGLDFCFDYKGAHYNFPTLIFQQMTYELSVVWQASRRHYRLSQTEECRTYYLYTERTLQQAAVQIMAEKQVAAAAVQGKFSADGLASMARGVDPRVKLAKMLTDGNNGESSEHLTKMFDTINTMNNSDDDSEAEYIPPLTFYELMEGTFYDDIVESVDDNNVSVIDVVETVDYQDMFEASISNEIVTEEIQINNQKKENIDKEKKNMQYQFSLFDLPDDFLKPVIANPELLEVEKEINKKCKKKAKKAISGQIDIFSALFNSVA